MSAFDWHAMFAKEDTIEALARRMALPVNALVATVAEYNQSVAVKADRLGRKHMPLPILKPPFYAIEQLGTSLFSAAGLDIDGDLRVLDHRGHPIPNLYAAGEVSGCWHTCGDFIVNGGALTPAMTFGHLLGTRLLKLNT